MIKSWLYGLAVDACPDIDEAVTVLGPVLPWLYRLKETGQDPGWHAEGNVHIHTGMVLQALYHLLATEASHIRGARRQALILSAILHDIGKPACTRPMVVRGLARIGSPDHEAMGRSWLAYQLPALLAKTRTERIGNADTSAGMTQKPDLLTATMSVPESGLSMPVMWLVLGLVGEHQMPKQLVNQNLGEGAYIALSRRADMELLYWLERADMSGRIGEKIPEQLAILEEFRLFAEEYGVWQQRYEPQALEPLLDGDSPESAAYVRALSIDALQRGAILTPEAGAAKFFQHKVDHPELYILCGPSGVGKSRFVARHCSHMDVVSLDLVRESLHGNRECQDNPRQVVEIARQQLKGHLRAQKQVVWDATNLRQDYRKPLYAIGRDYHALITLVLFLGPEAAIRSGNRNRSHVVPEEVLTQQLARFQFPRASDVHRLWLVDTDGHLYSGIM